MKRIQNMEAEVLDRKLVQEPRHKELERKVEREKILLQRNRRLPKWTFRRKEWREAEAG